MSVSKIVLSFDDGRKDNLRVVEKILEPNHIPATINLTTGYIDDTAGKDRRPGPNLPLSVYEAQRLGSYENIEIAGHGWAHLNTLEDLKKGLDTLREWFPDRKINGIASPNSMLSEEEILAMQPEFEAMGIDYVRIGAGATYHGMRRVMGKVSRTLHSNGLFIESNRGATAHTLDRFVLTSVPVMRQQKLHQVLALVRSCVERGEDLILMFHSIVKPDEPFYYDTWSWDYEDFELLCEYLVAYREAGDVILTTTAEAVAK